MKRVLAIIGVVVVGVFAAIGVLFVLGRALDLQFADAVPPESIQTFEDFAAWQTDIRRCREVQVRGVTYYHVIGPHARHLASSGALYVFDANGNYVGWSEDFGDIMRNEAVFYPNTWMPDESSVAEISYAELKQRLPQE